MSHRISGVRARLRSRNATPRTRPSDSPWPGNRAARAPRSSSSARPAARPPAASTNLERTRSRVGMSPAPDAAMARMRSMATFSVAVRSGTASASRIFTSASPNFPARISSSRRLERRRGLSRPETRSAAPGAAAPVTAAATASVAAAVTAPAAACCDCACGQRRRRLRRTSARTDVATAPPNTSSNAAGAARRTSRPGRDRIDSITHPF